MFMACGSTSSALKPKPKVAKKDTTHTETPKKTDEPEDPKKPIKSGKYQYINTPFKVKFLLPIPASDQTDAAVLSYYEGIKMAADSLQKMNIKMDIAFMNSKLRDSLAIVKIFNSPDIIDADIIVGPIFKSGFKQASLFGAKKNTPVISPFSSINYEEDNEKTSIYLAPNYVGYSQKIAQIIKGISNCNLVFLNDGTNENKMILNYLKKNISQPITEFKSGDALTFKNLLHNKKNNVIVAWTANKKTAYDISVGLNSVTSTNYMIAPASWFDLPNLDHQIYQIWQRNNIQIIADNFIDKNDPLTCYLASVYQQKYNAFPDEYFYKGFDHTMLLGLAYATYGPNFYEIWKNSTIEGTSMMFEMTTDQSQINKAVYTLILQEDGWQIKK